MCVGPSITLCVLNILKSHWWNFIKPWFVVDCYSHLGFCNCSVFCCELLCVHSSFAIILMGKRELIALLSLYSWCLLIVVWLFLVVLPICLQFVIVVFPDHTHLLFKHPCWATETSWSIIFFYVVSLPIILFREGITKVLISRHRCACWSLT